MKQAIFADSSSKTAILNHVISLTHTCLSKAGLWRRKMLGQEWQVFRSLHSLAINFLSHQQKGVEQWEDIEGKRRFGKAGWLNLLQHVLMMCCVWLWPSGAINMHLHFSLWKWLSLLRKGVIPIYTEKGGDAGSWTKNVMSCIISHTQSHRKSGDRRKQNSQYLKSSQALSPWRCNAPMWPQLCPLLQVAFPVFSILHPFWSA